MSLKSLTLASLGRLKKSLKIAVTLAALGRVRQAQMEEPDPAPARVRGSGKFVKPSSNSINRTQVDNQALLMLVLTGVI